MPSFVNRLYQFCYSRIPMLTYLTGQVTFGATGSVASIAGSQISAVTRLDTGIYRVRLSGYMNALINAHFTQVGTQSGGSVTAGSFVTGTQYQITALGNTNFNAIGLPSTLTAAVGMTFVATGAGSGTGTAKAVVGTGILSIQIAPGYTLTQAPSSPGGYFTMMTYDAAGALADPASGSIIRFSLFGRSSSLNQE